SQPEAGFELRTRRVNVTTVAVAGAPKAIPRATDSTQCASSFGVVGGSVIRARKTSPVASTTISKPSSSGARLPPSSAQEASAGPFTAKAWSTSAMATGPFTTGEVTSTTCCGAVFTLGGAADESPE